MTGGMPALRTAGVLALAAAISLRTSPGDGLTEVAWRVLVVVLATLGAVRLARAFVPERDGADPWSPWLAGLLFGCSPALVATTLTSPFDALVGATLPWVAAPLARQGGAWARAASAAWLGLAGLASAPWALVAVAVGLVAVAPRDRADLAVVVRWLGVAAVTCSWWVVGWSMDDGPFLLDRDGAGFATTLGRAAGWVDLPVVWSLAIVGGPVLCVLAALLWRVPGSRHAPAAVLVVAGIGWCAWAAAAGVASAPVSGWVDVPSVLLAAPPPALGDPVAAGLTVAALAGTIVWVPVMEHLLPRVRTRHRAATVAVVVIGAASGAGIAWAAHERVPESEEPLARTFFDQAIAGFSTQA